MQSGERTVLKIKGSSSIDVLSNFIRQGYKFFQLDLSDIYFITPPLVILTKFCIIKDIPILWPVKDNPMNYLRYMCSTFDLERSKMSSEYIPCFHIKSENDVWPITKRILTLLDDFINDKNKKDLSYVISELMENVFHHAKSDIGLLIHAQKYQKNNSIELSILDIGVGIDKSLKENIIYRDLIDFDAFKKAFEPTVTRSPETNAGEGLSSIKFWIELNDLAEGVIISNRFLWAKIIGPSGIVTGFFEKPYDIWPGTFLWLKIPRDPMSTLEDIWDILGLTP